ncbi:hypothetical protein C7B62_17990 [Pleurocapsa sp. CCALA 161]|uniref:hypothetical protein n=1 Tax=Pleurocapsa sp. CCALA 161 TaxID=2107688 RepID=UPI000D082BCE|nr:hypothetical protein [Pleurocapsa sp. CCALA 161]PSB08045.1 hypothetical protein C7B62_17990 [Pleurocapsa sp. CCALA 161]
MVDKIAFQSIGGVEGIYLPSKENYKSGTLLTDHGVFPAETSKQVRRTYPRFTSHDLSEPDGRIRLRFVAWVIGTVEAPYYCLDLRLLREEFPEWIEGENWFYIQGIVAERTPEMVSLRMQRNYWQNYTEETIASSINYLKIKNCPSSVRTSQFWKFTVSFREGFLHCLTGERLADASTTKKILKSWQTDPIDSSKSEELLKR